MPERYYPLNQDGLLDLLFEAESERWPLLAELWPRRARAYSVKTEWPEGFNYLQIFRFRADGTAWKMPGTRTLAEDLFDSLEVTIRHGLRSLREVPSIPGVVAGTMAGLEELGLSVDGTEIRFLQEPLVREWDGDTLPPTKEVLCEVTLAPYHRVGVRA